MMLVDGAFAEAIDGDEDIIGELCLAKRLWFRIGGIDWALIAASSSPVDRCTPHRICRPVNRAKKRST
jgi:hypothetical protein